MRTIIWFSIKLAGLRKWFAGDADFPTDDDFRNPFWRWFEDADRVNVLEAQTLIDVRMGYFSKANGKWVWWSRKGPHEWIRGVHSNFYNGILTYHKTWIRGQHIRRGTIGEWKRRNFVFRPSHKYYFLVAWGRVPDKGYMGKNFQFANWDSENEHNPGVIARDHEEGSV